MKKVTKKFKKIDVYETLLPGLQGVLGTQAGVKFALATSKNHKMVMNLAKKYEKDIVEAEQSQDYKDYQKERIAINIEYSYKQTNPDTKQEEPLIKGGQYQIIESKREEYDKKLEALNKEYKTILDKHTKAVKAHEDSINDEIKLDVFVVSEDHFPEKMSAQQLSTIDWMLDED